MSIFVWLIIIAVVIWTWKIFYDAWYSEALAMQRDLDAIEKDKQSRTVKDEETLVRAEKLYEIERLKMYKEAAMEFARENRGHKYDYGRADAYANDIIRCIDKRIEQLQKDF